MRNAALGAGLPTPPNKQVRSETRLLLSPKSPRSHPSHRPPTSGLFITEIFSKFFLFN